MIEVLKIIGSALVAAAATLITLLLKRKWEKQDKSEDKEKVLENKLDKLTEQVSALADKVDKLSDDLELEVVKDAGLQSGLREILYDRIKFLCRKYISEGTIREEDYNSLKRMWSVYHTQLAGNGFLDRLMEDIEKLEKS